MFTCFVQASGVVFNKGLHTLERRAPPISVIF